MQIIKGNREKNRDGFLGPMKALRKRLRFAGIETAIRTSVSPPDQMSTSASDGSLSSLFEGTSTLIEKRPIRYVSCLVDHLAADIQRGSLRGIQFSLSSKTRFTSLVVKGACCSIMISFLYLFPATFLRICLFVVLRKFFSIAQQWFDYARDDSERRRAFGAVKNLLRCIVNESEKAVDGDYARLVMAGYIIWNCTAPGESYFAYIIRYKMSALNHEVVNEIREWRERRLGYERSETKRNLFA